MPNDTWTRKDADGLNYQEKLREEWDVREEWAFRKFLPL